MKRFVTFAALISTLVAFSACQDDHTVPTSIEESTASRAETGERVAAGPVVENGACPCWTARSLGSTFPVASFWFEDVAPENRAGRVALQLSDVANARVLQALVEFDPETSTEGNNWCQIATFGQRGLERESISALKISAAEFDACVSLLEGQATATQLVGK